MFTNKQRIIRLVKGHDLERLEVICKNQKSIGTKRVLVELEKIRKNLLAHGIGLGL